MNTEVHLHMVYFQPTPQEESRGRADRREAVDRDDDDDAADLFWTFVCFVCLMCFFCFLGCRLLCKLAKKKVTKGKGEI